MEFSYEIDIQNDTEILIKLNLDIILTIKYSVFDRKYIVKKYIRTIYRVFFYSMILTIKYSIFDRKS